MNASCRVRVMDPEGMRQYIDSPHITDELLFASSYDDNAVQHTYITMEQGAGSHARPEFHAKFSCTAFEMGWHDEFIKHFVSQADENGTVLESFPHDFNGLYALYGETAVRVELSGEAQQCYVSLYTLPTNKIFTPETGVSYPQPDNYHVLTSLLKTWADVYESIQTLNYYAGGNHALTKQIDVKIDPLSPVEAKTDWSYEEARPDEFNIRDGFDSLGGLTHSKQRLLDIANTIKYPDLAAQYNISPSHVLMTGPPGTGKTSLAEAFANEINARFKSYRSSDIVDMWVGKSSRNLREIFEQATKSSGLLVLFFDEFEAIGGKPHTHNNERGSVVKELVEQITDISKNHPNILIMAATNADVDTLEPALVRSGRLERLDVPLPNEEERRDIWATIFMRSMANVNPEDNTTFALYDDSINLVELAQKTAGMTGADFVTILERARREKFRQALETKTCPQVTHQDILRHINGLYQ